MLVLKDNYGCFETTPKNLAKLELALSEEHGWKNGLHSAGKSADKADIVDNAVSTLYHMEDPCDFLSEQYWENVYEK